jgi:hypothetical protein
LANLFTQGYTTGAHALLDRARYVSGNQPQYFDGVWTYPWVWAIYLLKTGDLSFVKANFATEGPGGKTEPSIEDTEHVIAADRTGPGGIMQETNDIDANGYWTIDNYEALMGLWAYHWLALQVGDASEASWAGSQYSSLLAATNKTLSATISANHLNYLPCSMVEPNTDNRYVNAEDANWAAPFLFGRWAWDGYLFGAPLSGPGVSLIDATYKYGFGRLAGLLPANTFGGYPTQYWSTAYNAGYGEWAWPARTTGTRGSCRTSSWCPTPRAGRTHGGKASSSRTPAHRGPARIRRPAMAWGMANANMVLLDSLAAQRSDGSLIVGRGVPGSWVRDGQVISLANFPATGGRHLGPSIRISGGSVTLSLTGDQPSGPVLFQLPSFVGNIAHASAGTVDEKTGTVTVAPTVRSVTVTLTHA